MAFRDGKGAAFSMHFDDSMASQVENAMPLLNARGLVATFFVNPGSDRYMRHRQVWEEECLRNGHELADHTMVHGDVDDYAQADYEIGECARVIRNAYGNGSRLLPFIRPGGVRWGIDDTQLREILDRHELFLAQRSHGSFPSSYFTDITIPVQEAMARRAWTQLGFHGTGGEWLSTELADLVRLLDHLVANRALVWVATTGDVYKYRQELGAVQSVSLTDATAEGFTMEIRCDETRVNTYGRPFADVYDQPLTLRVEAPASWITFTVTQGQQTSRYDVVQTNDRRCAQFDIRPNVGRAEIRVLTR
jgi:hypothetical protein